MSSLFVVVVVFSYIALICSHSVAGTAVAVPTATPVSGASPTNPYGSFSALPAPNSSTTAAATSPVGGGAAVVQTEAVPLSSDVTSCPQCTFFNPSIARFCQMCGGALKPA